ncbi:hypothetical protein ACLBXX_02720 [Microbacterium sp. C23T]
MSLIALNIALAVSTLCAVGLVVTVPSLAIAALRGDVTRSLRIAGVLVGITACAAVSSALAGTGAVDYLVSA